MMSVLGELIRARHTLPPRQSLDLTPDLAQGLRTAAMVPVHACDVLCTVNRGEVATLLMIIFLHLKLTVKITQQFTFRVI